MSQYYQIMAGSQLLINGCVIQWQNIWLLTSLPRFDSLYTYQLSRSATLDYKQKLEQLIKLINTSLSCRLQVSWIIKDLPIASLCDAKVDRLGPTLYNKRSTSLGFAGFSFIGIMYDIGGNSMTVHSLFKNSLTIFQLDFFYLILYNIYII